MLKYNIWQVTNKISSPFIFEKPAPWLPAESPSNVSIHSYTRSCIYSTELSVFLPLLRDHWPAKSSEAIRPIFFPPHTENPYTASRETTFWSQVQKSHTVVRPEPLLLPCLPDLNSARLLTIGPQDLSSHKGLVKTPVCFGLRAQQERKACFLWLSSFKVREQALEPASFEFSASISFVTISLDPKRPRNWQSVSITVALRFLFPLVIKPSTDSHLYRCLLLYISPLYTSPAFAAITSFPPSSCTLVHSTTHLYLS